MRALQAFVILAAVATDAAEHGSLRAQPCDKDCQIERARSKVDGAEEALDRNMKASRANKKMIAYTKSIKGNLDITAQEKAVAAETQTTALGRMLGSMWGEMREYQSPMYEERLGVQSSKLAEEHASLQEQLARAREELDAATAKENAQDESDDDDDGDDEAPPAKLAIEKPPAKSVEMHSTKDDEEDNDNDDNDDDDDAERVSTAPVKAKTPCAEDANAVDESEQEVDTEEQKEAPNQRPWSNNGLAKGMAATAEQHAQLWKHGFRAGDPDRKGMYPVDLAAPLPDRPQWSVDAQSLIPRFSHAGDPFGKKTIVEAPPEDAAAAAAEDPAAAAAKDPAAVVEAATDDGEDEADAVKRVEAASEESKEDDAQDEDGQEKVKAPRKDVVGEGVSDGMSATHRQFKKFLSGGFFNGDTRQGLYPTDLTKT